MKNAFKKIFLISIFVHGLFIMGISNAYAEPSFDIWFSPEGEFAGPISDPWVKYSGDQVEDIVFILPDGTEHDNYFCSEDHSTDPPLTFCNAVGVFEESGTYCWRITYNDDFGSTSTLNNCPFEIPTLTPCCVAFQANIEEITGQLNLCQEGVSDECKKAAEKLDEVNDKLDALHDIISTHDSNSFDLGFYSVILAPAALAITLSIASITSSRSREDKKDLIQQFKNYFENFKNSNVKPSSDENIEKILKGIQEIVNLNSIDEIQKNLEDYRLREELDTLDSVISKLKSENYAGASNEYNVTPIATIRTSRNRFPDEYLSLREMKHHLIALICIAKLSQDPENQILIDLKENVIANTMSSFLPR